MKVLFTKKGESYLWQANDLHTKYGVLREDKIKQAKAGKVLKTNTGKEMSVTNPLFIDLFSRIRRNAQIMLPKDIAQIIAETGINSKSFVLDCGAGSGANACFLANFVEKVVTYEKRDDFIRTVKKNIESLGQKNIQIKKKDIYEGIDEKNIDCIILDIPMPWKALDHAIPALKHSGYIVSYLPNVIQVKQFVEEILERNELLYIKTKELIEREWEIDKNRCRPKFQILGHTGFLTFARKF